MMVLFRIGWWGVWIMKVKKREVKNKYVIKNGKKLGKLG